MDEQRAAPDGGAVDTCTTGPFVLREPLSHHARIAPMSKAHFRAYHRAPFLPHTTTAALMPDQLHLSPSLPQPTAFPAAAASAAFSGATAVRR